MSQDKPEFLSKDLTKRFLRSLKNRFYAPAPADRLFYQEKNMLLQAITFPAVWLDRRHVKLTAAQYETILIKIIRTINQHGQLSTVSSPGRYLLKCVQTHMAHHGDTYYQRAKATRTLVDDVLAGVITDPAKRAQAETARADSTTAELAAAYRLLEAPKGGRKKSSPPADSANSVDLFAAANPLQSNFLKLAKPAKTPKKVLKPMATRPFLPKSSQTSDSAPIPSQPLDLQRDSP